MVKLLSRNERLEVFDDNKFVGYVENDKLTGFDRDGYAVEICQISNNNEIAGALKEWHSTLAR